MVASNAHQDIVMRSGRKLEVQEYGAPTGHPVFFFHGLIGSHYQASYIADQAQREDLRVIAPNRPGVGRSDFVLRSSAISRFASRPSPDSPSGAHSSPAA